MSNRINYYWCGEESFIPEADDILEAERFMHEEKRRLKREKKEKKRLECEQREKETITTNRQILDSLEANAGWYSHA